MFAFSASSADGGVRDVRGDVQRVVESWKGSRCWWLEHHNPGLEKQPSVSKYDLYKLLTGVREDRPDWAAVSAKVGRGVISRFDRTTKAFYDRCQNGGKPGYPRSSPAAAGDPWRYPTLRRR